MKDLSYTLRFFQRNCLTEQMSNREKNKGTSTTSSSTHPNSGVITAQAVSDLFLHRWEITLHTYVLSPIPGPSVHVWTISPLSSYDNNKRTHLFISMPSSYTLSDPNTLLSPIVINHTVYDYQGMLGLCLHKQHDVRL